MFVNNNLISNPIYTIDSQTLLLQNINSNAIQSNSLISIIVDSIKNPHNFNQTSSFSISVFNNGYYIEEIKNGLALKMNTSTSFNEVNIIPQSKKNGDNTLYTVRFNSSINIISGYNLIITIPTTVSISNPSCSSSNYICSLSSNNLSVIINQNIDYSQIISINVSGFTNPRIYSSTGPFQFNLYSSNNLYSSSTFNGFTNFEPNNIVNFSKTHITPNQSYLNSTQSIKFSVITYNKLIMSNN